MATVNLKGCTSLLPLPPTQNIQLLGEGTEPDQPPRGYCASCVLLSRGMRLTGPSCLPHPSILKEVSFSCAFLHFSPSFSRALSPDLPFCSLALQNFRMDIVGHLESHPQIPRPCDWLFPHSLGATLTLSGFTQLLAYRGRRKIEGGKKNSTEAEPSK